MNAAAPNSRGASSSALLERLGSWRPTLRQIAIIYMLGFLFCWLSLWAGLRQRGPEPFVSPLYGFMLLFEEALRDVLNRFPTLRPTFYPPSLTSLPVMLACALVAEFFATGTALIRSAHKPLRWGGLVLLVILAFATFSWSPIPPLPHPGFLLPPVLLPVARFFTMRF
ncbi:MAG TPA: hypothetical protein VNJ12_12745 [Candidatus Dormibacteraeota bacterium]|nr:hypothetical protein [Candidatus Dormibacteraeota bacterium]